MRETPDLKAVSDDGLLRGLFEILEKTRQDEAELVAHIAEVDARKLYAREATPSMFVWCTERLHLSEQEAYLRIAVARASREHPMLLPMLREGRLHLSGIARLAPHLTPENRDAVLKRAAGMSHREVKELVSELEPKPDAPAKIRKLPDRAAHPPAATSLQLCAHRVARPPSDAPQEGSTAQGIAAKGVSPGDPASPSASPPPWAAPSPSPAASIEPLAPARFKVQFTASAELRDKLERLQALMRGPVPDGDLAMVVEIAVTRELERLEARRFGKTRKPRKKLARTDTKAKSRYIPAAVRRHVEERDGGRCTYEDRHGRRCGKRHDLEFHRRRPFGLGGDHDPEDLALMCRTHNALLAEADFGKKKMARHRRRGRPESSGVQAAAEGGGARSSQGTAAVTGLAGG
jgi:hypothetical protein